MPWLFIIKICFTITVNTICVASQLLVSGWLEFVWQVQFSGSLSQDSGSQGLKSQVPGYQPQGPRCQGAMSQCPRSRVSSNMVQVSESQLSGSHSPKVPGPMIPGLGSLTIAAKLSILYVWVLDKPLDSLFYQLACLMGIILLNFLFLQPLYSMSTIPLVFK